MERWRWVPRDLGKTYVMVNIPDYTLRVMRDDKLVWKTKIVVGKPNLATPLISAEMKFITVNPTWNVPPSIIQNEYLPALQADPHGDGAHRAEGRAGPRRHTSASTSRRATATRSAASASTSRTSSWCTSTTRRTSTCSPMSKRAYSHGCMRVQDPLKYGEVLLSLALPNENYTADRLQKMFGGSEININFPTIIPVHITYQTAFVDDEGKLQIRDDVYGRDQRLLAILKGSERKVADIAGSIRRTASNAPVRMAPGTFGGGGSFFGGGDRSSTGCSACRRRRRSRARASAATPTSGARHSADARHIETIGSAAASLRPICFWQWRGGARVHCKVTRTTRLRSLRELRRAQHRPGGQRGP